MDLTDNILAQISAFEPVDDLWLPLDHLLENLWETDEPERGKEVLLNVFEKFPEEDGSGVLWSIVHGLEHLGDYEGQLVASLQRQPSLMGVSMLRAIQNSGQSLIEGQNINLLYQDIIDHPLAPESIKKLALYLKELK